MIRTMTMLALGLLACSSAKAENGTALWRENRRLEKEAGELRARVNALENSCIRHEKTAKTLEVTGDLMSGRRQNPPRRIQKFVDVAVFETNAVRVIDNRSTRKSDLVRRWLELKTGSRYRFTCQMKAEFAQDMKRLKFGGFVPVKGAGTQWPAAFVGAGPFDWQTVAFEYELPPGATFCLLYGIEGGTARVSVRDVSVVEIVETEE